MVDVTYLLFSVATDMTFLSLRCIKETILSIYCFQCELNLLSQNHSDPTKSAFHQCNLPGALAILNGTFPEIDDHLNKLLPVVYRQKKYTSARKSIVPSFVSQIIQPLFDKS